MARPQWLLLGASLALLAAVLASAPLSEAGPLSRGFSGLSELASASYLATSPGQLLSGASRAAIVVDPMLEPSAADISALRSLLSAGGTVLVVGSGPAVNELLRGLGANMSVEYNLTIIDVLSNAGSFYMPSTTFNGGQLVLLNASPIELGPGAQALASTSPFSFARLLNGNELAGPFVVAAQQRVSRGLVVLVSSPYALSNGLINYSGNRALLSYVTGGSRPYLAAFLWRLSPAQLTWIEVSEALAPLRPYSAALGALASMAAGAAVYLWRASDAGGAVSEELDEVITRHPEWDPELLRQLDEERRHSR